MILSFAMGNVNLKFCTSRIYIRTDSIQRDKKFFLSSFRLVCFFMHVIKAQTLCAFMRIYGPLVYKKKNHGGVPKRQFAVV